MKTLSNENRIPARHEPGPVFDTAFRGWPPQDTHGRTALVDLVHEAAERGCPGFIAYQPLRRPDFLKTAKVLRRDALAGKLQLGFLRGPSDFEPAATKLLRGANWRRLFEDGRTPDGAYIYARDEQLDAYVPQIRA